MKLKPLGKLDSSKKFAIFRPVELNENLLKPALSRSALLADFSFLYQKGWRSYDWISEACMNNAHWLKVLFRI